jgi:hypothetical protein
MRQWSGRFEPRNIHQTALAAVAVSIELRCLVAKWTASEIDRASHRANTQSR